jgi:drug/metabolite transporter (DMT)-like permease
MDDLRRPTGYLFALLGLILSAYAVLNPDVRAPLDPGVNVYLWCGLGILVFGGVLLWLSFRRKS